MPTPNPKTLTFDGKTNTIREWAEILGIQVQSLRARLKRMSVQSALSKSKFVPAHILGTKDCTKCGETLPLDSFHNLTRRNGLEYYPKCKTCANIESCEKRINLKNKVIAKYSNGSMCCHKCGYDDIRALDIDHKNNDGRENRGRAGGCYYREYLKEDRNDLQVLCRNCNWIKHIDNIRGS